MPTDDERHEVARILREQAREGYGVNLGSIAYALGGLDSDYGECGDEDVFNMLADLIDPEGGDDAEDDEVREGR